MKVGIMSMQRIINYGSYLQALGLKHTIESLGHEVEFVDYTVEPCINKRQVKTSSAIMSKVKRVVKKVLRIQKPQNKFMPMREQFCKDYVEKMLPVLGVTKERKYRTKVDTLVIGSDEVFNCLQDNPDVGYSMELFGANNNAKRVISYAGSFGNTTCERLESYGVKNEVKGLLEKFDSISVRDKNSGKVVSTLLKKEPVYNLDPVLISDFTPFVKDTVTISDYIIVYAYSRRINEEEGQKIIEFAKKRGKKLVAISGIQTFCDSYVACTPEEVLAYFKHADCIITDTFHGSIFSIINEKPFVTIIRESKGESYGNAEKLVDLLERLHLEDRILHNMNDLEKTMTASIDYKTVGEIRKEGREHTLKYLQENL